MYPNEKTIEDKLLNGKKLESPEVKYIENQMMTDVFEVHHSPSFSHKKVVVEANDKFFTVDFYEALTPGTDNFYPDQIAREVIKKEEMVKVVSWDPAN
jgi:hypothetical protein